MGKWMTDFLEEAPAICLQLLKEKDKAIEPIVNLYTSKQYERIVMVGSGSSYNIAMCSKYALEKFLKIPVEVIAPMTYTQYDFRYKNNALVICMSQSGRSTNTIDAIIKSNECNYDVLAISTVPNSPMSEYCDNVLEFGNYISDDDSFVCRYFTSSVLYFFLFAISAALKLELLTKEDYKLCLKELNNIVNDMPKVIENVKSVYDENVEDLISMKRVMAMGVGPLFGLTNEACLKISETTGIPTNGYEVEEFLHGPAYEVKKDHALFFMDGDSAVHDRIISIAEACKELTNNVYLITNSNIFGKKVIRITTKCDPVFRSILYVIPFQYIPGKICEDTRARAITIYNYRVSQKVNTKR